METSLKFENSIETFSVIYDDVLELMISNRDLCLFFEFKIERPIIK